MKTYTIQFEACVEAEDDEQVQNLFLEYLQEIVQHEDLTAFLIQEETQQ